MSTYRVDVCGEFITQHVKCRECREFIFNIVTFNFFDFSNFWGSFEILDILDTSTIRHVDKLLHNRELFDTSSANPGCEWDEVHVNVDIPTFV